ncbi:MAG: HEXXH motif-containing putative peptide modification protein [Flavobacterium sp.]|nr:HEXXH motif-containing putative peptide modification protein [Flavobacterium sp.]
MSLHDKIAFFLDNPFPLWETELTKMLVQNEWKEQLKYGITPDNYSTAKSFLKKSIEIEKKSVLISGDSIDNSIYLEYPSFENLQEFYEEHGLEPELDNNSNGQTQKLQAALDILNLVPEVKHCISFLVKRIQILRQVDEEIDTSYSHPEIPFTIFVSLCKDDSINSNIRVAESILHEAMHLKLTLIEKHIDLIVPNTNETYYSPWREEQRPVRGVLHGLFVFGAVLGLYKKLEFLKECSSDEKRYIATRIFEINKEFETILSFKNSNGLTSAGRLFCSMLL